MAPKKGQKMSLNEFLGDDTLGSWADEMDSLPTAPAPRTDEERVRDFGRSDYSSRPDRTHVPVREDVPLPAQPPYTAFVGNLAFDMSEIELEEFFAPHKAVSVKIITDRDGKPKGFGYVEFAELAGLKYALGKTGSTLSHRTVRVNVAEPPKERDRGVATAGGYDEDKLLGNWRREKPLPPPELPSRGQARGSGFGFRDTTPGEDEGPRRGARFIPTSGPTPTAERPELDIDWRNSRSSVLSLPERDRESRRGLGGSESAADVEESWTRGAKFRPSPAGSETGSMGRKFGAGFAERGGTAGSTDEISDWRSRSRAGLGGQRQSNEQSPTNSMPPTPQLARKKLELLPRSASTNSTPLSSPSPGATFNSKSNPFGAAKPVDVTAREKEVEERLDREREEAAVRHTMHTMSREPSRQPASRPEHPLSREASRQASTRGPPPQQRKSSSPPASAVRPAISFANAAKKATETQPKDTKDMDAAPAIEKGAEIVA